MENSEYNDISDSADYVGDNLCLYVLEPGVYDWVNIAIYTSDGAEICNRTYSVENIDYYIEDGEIHYVEWNEGVEENGPHKKRTNFNVCALFQSCLRK